MSLIEANKTTIKTKKLQTKIKRIFFQYKRVSKAKKEITPTK